MWNGAPKLHFCQVHVDTTNDDCIVTIITSPPKNFFIATLFFFALSTFVDCWYDLRFIVQLAIIITIIIIRYKKSLP